MNEERGECDGWRKKKIRKNGETLTLGSKRDWRV